jgi:hypothetical protein
VCLLRSEHNGILASQGEFRNAVFVYTVLNTTPRSPVVHVFEESVAPVSGEHV